MTDRFLRACRREPVDATPVWFMRQAGRSLPEYRAIRQRASLVEITRDPALCAEVTLQPVRRLGVDAAILFADITTPLPGIGLEVDLVEGMGPRIADPVRTAADLARLRPFEPKAAVGPLLEAIRLVRAESPVPLIGFAGAPFTLASYIVEGHGSSDARRLKRLIHGAPEVADDLLGRLTDLTLLYLAAQVAAGVQAVQVFDSWAGALDPFDYRRAVLPHMRRLFDGLARLGVPVIHFSTGTAGMIELVAAAGGDVIGVDWRIDLDAAWQRLPGHAIMGNLDPTAALAPWPTLAERARSILAAAGGQSGHIFNLGHGVQPETDPGQLRDLVDLVHAETARQARDPSASPPSSPSQQPSASPPSSPSPPPSTAPERTPA